jgi:hypothetical protein
VLGWTPWQGKPEFQKLSGKVELLPRKADARDFYSWMFPGVSDIEKVHFPSNWQPDRFDAMVDLLGGASEATPPQNGDEDVYFSLAPTSYIQDHL